MSEDKLYEVEKGRYNNPDAIVVKRIISSRRSLSFMTNLKATIRGENNKSKGEILTYINGQVTFHDEEDFEYFTSKAERMLAEEYNRNAHGQAKKK